MPCDFKITEAAVRIAAGELLPTQLVESCLERINLLEEKIKAWALVDHEGARETARRLDKELRQGRIRSPLHGIPVGIKDIIYTAGLRTEAGSASWAGFTPTYDATVISRLKDAGAIILGKTHSTQFAHLDPAPTRNPWNIEHTPGGSSSGSGASVAAGMCLAALGTQTGGSTLRPAAFNGIVGLKGEHGRISAYGVVPLSWNLDHVGVLARGVEDAALVFQALAGYDSNDVYSLTEPVPDCLAALHGEQKPPHLGLARQYFFDQADEEMRCQTEEAARRLRLAGAEVTEIALPGNFPDTSGTNGTIMAVEAATYHQEMFLKDKEQYRANIRRMIEEGLATPVTEYARALKARLEQRAAIEPVMHKIDAVLTPGAPGTAPRDLSITGSSVMQRPWSTTGLPSISLPVGLAKNGLPLAIQLAGGPLAEDHLLRVALWCEKVLDVHLQPPLN